MSKSASTFFTIQKIKLYLCFLDVRLWLFNCFCLKLGFRGSKLWESLGFSAYPQFFQIYKIRTSFEEVSTPGQTQTGLGPRVILLLPQATVLPGSDAGSDVIKFRYHRALSSKTVRPCATCGARCIEHAVRTWCAFVQRRHTRNSMKKRDPICAWMNGIAQHQFAGGWA